MQNLVTFVAVERERERERAAFYTNRQEENRINKTRVGEDSALKDSGFVIYEGEEEVTDTNVADAQKTRNQYVWVPVEDISKFYGTDANGKSWGKLYNFTTGTNSSSTFDEVTGTYAYNWSESNGVMSISNSRNYREPDVLRDRDTPYYLKTYKVSEDSMLDFLLRQQVDFKKMIYSVEKYGGFYIGRYETGDLSKEQVVVQKGNTDITSQT